MDFSSKRYGTYKIMIKICSVTLENQWNFYLWPSDAQWSDLVIMFVFCYCEFCWFLSFYNDWFFLVRFYNFWFVCVCSTMSGLNTNHLFWPETQTFKMSENVALLFSLFCACYLLFCKCFLWLQTFRQGHKKEWDEFSSIINWGK